VLNLILNEKRLIGLKYLFIVVILHAIFLTINFDDLSSIRLISILVSAIVLWSLYNEFRYTVIKITPVLMIYLSLLSSSGIGMIYLTEVTLKEFGMMPFVNQAVTIEEINFGLLIQNFGSFSYLVGYIKNENESDFEPSIKGHKPIESTMLILYFFILILIGSISKLKEISGIFLLLINALPFTFLLYIAIIYPKNKKSTFLLVTLTLILFTFYLSQLSKYALIISIFPLFLYLMNLVKNKISLYIIFTLVLVLVTQFIFPFIGAARYKFYNKERNTISVNEAVEFITSGESQKNREELLILSESSNEEDFFTRLTEIGAPSYIYRLVRTNGFKLGQDLGYIFYGLIPRFLWPSKPIISRGGEFTKAITGEEEATTSTGMGAAGELYWEFGFPGIFLGMYILGYLFAQVKNNATKIKSPIISICIYFFLFNYITSLPEWGAALLGAIMYYFYSYLGILISGVKIRNNALT